MTILATEGRARRGQLHMRAGIIDTPAFMPVGTQATVKSLTPGEVRATGSQIILNNAYHLYLRPGVELVEKLGGLHKFQAWDGGILTDSGGYQIFSLSSLHKVEEQGLTFKSHIDGSEHFMSPEKAIETQQRLGADIFMSFDQPIPWGATREETREATDRTHRWAARGKTAWRPETGQVLYGIVQGGFEEDLRKESAQTLVDMDFPGYSIGGLSVGEPKEVMWAMLDVTTPILPEQKPRYLMGVGTPSDLVHGVLLGVDMFDCVLPTRMGRNGTIFTWEGRMNLRNAQYESDPGPLDPRCSCAVCQTFSRAYLRHLLKAGEILAIRSLSYHNIAFYQQLMATIRTRIVEGTFSQWAKEFLASYKE
ncbi:MAG TPA: tRNA guanosine(34) transglycosylase Tgt [Armatimonadota bacterium]|nr:tRNA guanosine(34) transglycosylase Tgt [Armatimonadota bacterium]